MHMLTHIHMKQSQIKTPYLSYDICLNITKFKHCEQGLFWSLLPTCLFYTA